MFILKKQQIFLISLFDLEIVEHFKMKQLFYETAAFIAHPLTIIREASYKALSKLKDDRIFPLISKLMESENPLERIYALTAMRYLKDERTVYILLKALKDNNKSVRYFAVQALEKMNRREAYSSFISIIKSDKNNKVRIETIHADW